MYSEETRTKQRTLGEFCRHLEDLAYIPNTIVDVGVASYTEGLYGFRDATFFLFEPLPFYLEPAQKLIEGKKGTVYQMALSDSNGNCVISARDGAPDSAAISGISGKNVTDYNVQMMRLDHVLTTENITSPSLLKIDVQGHDYFVLKGAGNLLKSFDIVIFEFMYLGDVEFNLYVELLSKNGFSLYEVISNLRRPYDDAVSQSDFVFVKTTSELRSYKRYV